MHSCLFTSIYCRRRHQHLSHYHHHHHHHHRIFIIILITICLSSCTSSFLQSLYLPIPISRFEVMNYYSNEYPSSAIPPLLPSHLQSLWYPQVERQNIITQQWKDYKRLLYKLIVVDCSFFIFINSCLF